MVISEQLFRKTKLRGKCTITKLKNDNEKYNVCTECTKNKILFLRVILAFCILLLFYRTSSKVLLYTVGDNFNDFLVQ